MSERAQYLADLAAGRDCSMHDFRPNRDICPDCHRAVLQSWQDRCFRCTDRREESRMDARDDADHPGIDPPRGCEPR